MKAFTETELRLLRSMVHHLRAEVLSAERLVHQAVHVAPQLVDLGAQRLDGLDHEVGDGFGVSIEASGRQVRFGARRPHSSAPLHPPPAESSFIELFLF